MSGVGVTVLPMGSLSAGDHAAVFPRVFLDEEVVLEPELSGAMPADAL